MGGPEDAMADAESVGVVGSLLDRGGAWNWMALSATSSRMGIGPFPKCGACTIIDVTGRRLALVQALWGTVGGRASPSPPALSSK